MTQNDYTALFKQYHAQKGEHYSHCSKPTRTTSGGRYGFNRKGLEKLFDLHCELVFSDPGFISATLEMPQHYSMLRVDMDYKR